MSSTRIRANLVSRTSRANRNTFAATALVGAATLALATAPIGASASASRTIDHHHRASRLAAQGDAANLRAAAQAVENVALDGGALTDPVPYQQPAKILDASVNALLVKARHVDRGGDPTDTRAVMGALPPSLLHRPAHHPKHHRVTVTHVFTSFVKALADRGSNGLGLGRKHDGARPAVVQRRDGEYVDPSIPALSDPTVAMVAVRAALKELGQPYVWAGAGPKVFDCSGLTQWAYAKAGIPLGHYTGLQWNEGALIPPRDILPGDLILFEEHVRHHGEYIEHVGMYLGAGWMVNAPYTGQYVNVVPVPYGFAGVVRP